MRIKFASISDAELAELIAGASAELHGRLVAVGSDVIRKPAPRSATIIVDEPTCDDKDFMLSVKSQMLQGQYVRSEDRSRFKAIAAAFPAWIKVQGLPDDPGGTAGRRWAERNVRYAPAPER